MESITNSELAILGLLAESAAHGYQIEQLIEARGFREWTEIGFSSIYYALNRLEEAGWLESAQETAAGIATESEAQPIQADVAKKGVAVPARGPGRAKRSGPARRIYHLTQAGWEAYRSGVRERLAHPRPRSGDFDLALANLPALPPAEARAALETYRAGLRARLDAVHTRWQQDRAAQAHQSPGTAPDGELSPGTESPGTSLENEQAPVMPGTQLPEHVEALFDHAAAGLAAELAWVDKFLKE